MQTRHTQSYIAQKLDSFFKSKVNHSNSFNGTPIQHLPFWDTLFTKTIQLPQHQKSDIQSSNTNLSNQKPNLSYFVNVLKYLSAYFTNKTKLFKIFCQKTKKIQAADTKYFMDELMSKLDHQYHSQNSSQINEMPVKQVVSYWAQKIEGQSDTQNIENSQNMDQTQEGHPLNRLETMNEKIQGMKMFMNTLLGLPEIWLNSKMSAKSKNSNEEQNFPLKYAHYKFMISILIVRQLSNQLEDRSNSYIENVLLHVLNRILMQTSFVSQVKYSLGDQSKIASIWQCILFRSSLRKNPLGIQMKIQHFIIKSFSNLVKRQKLTQLLFYLFVTGSKNQIFQLIVQIFTQNQTMKQEFYFIIQTTSELAQTYLKPSMYSKFYDLIQKIDQKLDNFQSSDSFHNYCMKKLSFWWSLNKDSPLTNKMCLFRHNLLAYMIENTHSEFLNQEEGANILDNISEGARLRIIDSRYHSSAILVSTKLIVWLKLEFDQNDHFAKKKVAYFQDPKQQQKPQQNVQTEIQDKRQTQIDLKETNKSTQGQEPHQNQENSNHRTNIPVIANQQSETFEDNTEDMFEVKLKPPQTLQDCIMALQNPIRRQVGFKQLNKLLLKQPADVIFVWKSLIRSLMHPLVNQSKEPLKTLFVLRPKEWIQDVGELYFKKDIGLDERTIFIEILQLGVNSLTENPHQLASSVLQEEDDKKQFYFKRVSSKYYTEKNYTPSLITQDESRTKRWGHTKIAFQKSKKLSQPGSNPVNSLMIVNSNEPYINRLYEVVSELFFKIVIKMAEGIDKSVKSMPLYTQHVMNLLSAIAQNIKNYFEKYLILEDISLTCLKVLIAIEKLSTNPQKTQGFSGIFNSPPKWDKKAMSQIVVSCIQALNKVALALDKYVPELMMMNLRDCIQKLKKIDIYSLRPLIEMLQANIYKNTSSLPLDMLSSIA